MADAGGAAPRGSAPPVPAAGPVPAAAPVPGEMEKKNVTIRAPQVTGPVDDYVPFGYVPKSKTYNGYAPLAPSDFPSMVAGGDYIVDESMVREKPHTSMPAILGMLLFFALFVPAIVILALIAKCKITTSGVDLCDEVVDISSNFSFYNYTPFPFLVPMVYVFAALAAGLFGLIVACFYGFSVIRREVGSQRMAEAASYIRQGTMDFAFMQFFPILAVSTIFFVLIGAGLNWRMAGCYGIGAAVSFASMLGCVAISTRGSVRAAAAAETGLGEGLSVTFRSAAAVALTVASSGAAGLAFVYIIFRDVRALAGFSAGASTAAIVGRLGGGIFAKASDVGTDAVAKLETNIPEDDPRNPATVADKVGDSVGDINGMAGDLFESFVGAIVGTAILGASLPFFMNNPFAMCVYNHLYIDDTCGTPENPPYIFSYANTLCGRSVTLLGETRALYEFYPSSDWTRSVPMFIALPFMMAMVAVCTGILCTLYVHAPRTATEDKAKGDVMESLMWSLRTNSMLSSMMIIGAAAGLCFGFFGTTSNFADQRGFKDDNLPVFRFGNPSNPCVPPPASTEPLFQLDFMGRYSPYYALGVLYPDANQVSWRLFIAIIIGVFLGVLVIYISDFFSSGGHGPTQGISAAGEYGAGAIVIQGLGVGMLATVLPLALIVAVIIGSYNLFGSYAVGLSAVGLTNSIVMKGAIDAFGAIADAGSGIAEMSDMHSTGRSATDVLQALGVTMSGAARGYSHAASLLTAYALLAALVQVSGLYPTARLLVGAAGLQPTALVVSTDPINLVDIYIVGAVFIGIMLPFFFSALILLAVSRTAQTVVLESRLQFREIRGLRERVAGVRPDFLKIVRSARMSAFLEMILPGSIPILAPLIMGFGFGQRALVGMLIGIIGSGYLLALVLTNSGCSWENAKKLVESGFFGKRQAKGSDWHRATVAADAAGDAMKDASGLSLNVLVKLSVAFGLVPIPLMNPDITRGWVGAIILVVSLLAALLFILLWLRNVYDSHKKTRAKYAKKDGEKPPALDAKSPYFAGGYEVNTDNVYKGSALADAYDIEGGDRAVKMGVIKDPLNMPGLYSGVEDAPVPPPKPEADEYVIKDDARTGPSNSGPAFQ